MEIKSTGFFHTENIDGEIDGIRKAAEVIRNAGLVIFPTETVYGIGANALDSEAVSGIFRAKNRPADNPLIVHVTSLSEIEPLVTDFPEKARKLAEAFWPGPLTIILPKSAKVPMITSGGLDTVAVRMPSHPVARALISLSGVPIAAPSANISGSPSPTKAKHCIKDMTGRVDIILDGGDCAVGLESTVITLAERIPRILRPGAVTHSMLSAVIGEVEVDEAVTHMLCEGRPVSSPGMKYKHYAPKAELTIVHSDRDNFYEFACNNADTSTYFMGFDEDMRNFPNALSYGAEMDSAGQARNLFTALREIDDISAEKVYVRAPCVDEIGLAVYNRLLRASAFREIYL